MSKYGNRKTFIGSVGFDSKREAERYKELLLLQRSGEISNLQLQVPFELIPAIRENGKVVQRPIKYVADFTYSTRFGVYVVEDAKGMRTEVYKIKKKLMRWKYGIQIKEV